MSFLGKVKGTVWKYLGSLVTDKKAAPDGTPTTTMSLGRLAFVAVFGLAMYMWSPWGGSTEIPGDMFTLLWSLLLYNLGGKAVSAYQGKNDNGLNPYAWNGDITEPDRPSVKTETEPTESE